MCKKIILLLLVLLLLVSVYVAYYFFGKALYLLAYEYNHPVVVDIQTSSNCSDWSWVKDLSRLVPDRVIWDRTVTVTNLQPVNYAGYVEVTPLPDPTVQHIRLFVELTNIHIDASLDCEKARIILRKELVGAAFSNLFRIDHQDFVSYNDPESKVLADGLALLFVFNEWDGYSIPSCSQLEKVAQLSSVNGYKPVLSVYNFRIQDGGISYLLNQEGCQ